MHFAGWRKQPVHANRLITLLVPRSSKKFEREGSGGINFEQFLTDVYFCGRSWTASMMT